MDKYHNIKIKELNISQKRKEGNFNIFFHLHRETIPGKKWAYV